MSRFEDDPSFLRKRVHARWYLDEIMRGCDAGELALIVGLAICEAWTYEHKTSYGYELAWIFERDRGTIRNTLHYLEETGAIERVDPMYTGRRVFYKPTTKAEADYLRSDDQTGLDDLWAECLHESCPCHKIGKARKEADRYPMS